MRLITLHLFNFQGIKDLRLDFGGRNAAIYGDNATGKTTVFNAITWLLFDKASTGAKNFTPKTKGADGKDIHYLEHGVEACFALDDGQELTLRKVYKESYKKKHGSAHEEFDGHEIKYSIDGVPFKEKEYIAALTENFGSIERVKMLIMPDYFSSELPWDNRRRILLDMCGDISDRDVIGGTKELEGLLDFLAMPGASDKHYTVDEYKKIAAAKRTEINKELQTIPARIDEAQKAMPDISGIDLAKIDADIAEINAAIEEKELEKRQVLAGDATVDTLRKQISALQTQLAESRSAYAAEQAKVNEGVYAEIAKLKGDQSNLRKALHNKKDALDSKQRQLSAMLTERKNLLDSYAKVSAGEWQGDEICPTCDRPLPEIDVVKAKEAFNLAKSTKLEEINKEGQRTCSKDGIALLEAEVAVITGDIASTEGSIADFDNLIAEQERKVRQVEPFENSEAHKSITELIQHLRNNESQAGGQVSQQAALLTNEITALRNRIDELVASKSKLTLAEHQTKRIDELAASEKRLSSEYEALQHGVFLCEEFIKAKVSMLTDKINSKFETVRFRLFVEQINGGVKEDCEVMVSADGRLVPYTFANNAAKINAGLEIINALAKHYETSIPVFVDNAESITRLQDVDTQLIRLIVSESDKILRLEVS